MEIACPAHHFARHVVGQLYELLGEVGKQLVAFVKAIGHVECDIVFLSLLIAVGGIGIDIGAPAAIQHIGSGIALCLIAKVALTLYKAFHPVGHLHVYVEHIVRAYGALCHTSVVTHLYLVDVLCLHLAEDESVVAVYRGIVYAQVVGGYYVLVTCYHEVGHHL